MLLRANCALSALISVHLTARAGSWLRQYVIDEEKAIYIMRRINIENTQHCRGRDKSSINWHAEIVLYFTSKATRFMRDSVNPQYVGLGHKSSLQSLSGASSNFSVDPTLANVNTFSTVPSCVDWAVVRHWIAVCDNERNTCRREFGAGKLPMNFRLLDVQSESIVDAHVEPYPSFVSLSYIWGADPSHGETTCRDNLAFLKQPGSLRDLPRTIKDALEVCKRLGEKYIWVNRLCIVQDD